MWRFYIITGIFAGFAAVILLLPLPGLTHFYLLCIDLITFILVIAFGSSRISTGMFIRAICKGDPGRYQVAITFDDGPDPVRSPEILEILQRHNCQASFFLTGEKVKGNESILRDMVEAGHTIGNHSFSHSTLFPFFSARNIAGEILSTNQVIERLTGRKVLYFRPPFGVTNPNISRGLRGLEMKVVGWSIRSYDTRNESEEVVLRRISGRLKGGAIILLHETSEKILEILEQLLELLEYRGLEAVSLDVLLKT
jgi:peptidoglycan/xylan/chitin deacetylase (PgdA/CDA1 family)